MEIRKWSNFIGFPREDVAVTRHCAVIWSSRNKSGCDQMGLMCFRDFSFVSSCLLNIQVLKLRPLTTGLSPQLSVWGDFSESRKLLFSLLSVQVWQFSACRRLIDRLLFTWLFLGD